MFHKYANAASLEIGKLSITSYPRHRGARLHCEVFRAPTNFHASIGWSHPRRHAWWARTITLNLDTKPTNKPYKTIIRRYWFA